MNKIILYQLFAFLSIFGVSTTINAQVTIGLSEEPAQGALLQIKNIEGDNAENSTKGLGLPRVQLQNLTGDLAKSLNNAATVGDLDAGSHIGLLIYNVPKDSKCPVIDPGLYVWSGTEWMSLIKKDLSRIGSVTGKSGIAYRTRVFGTAGEWMIDNLRETEYELPETGTLIADRNASNNKDIKSYYFPANIDHTGVIEDDRQLYEAYPKMGLLYTSDGASNGSFSDSFNTGAGAVKSTVQGICPAGWVLPSDKDWTDLEREIATHPELYSKSPAGSTMWSSAAGQGGIPDEDWAITQNGNYARPSTGSNGHGLSMTFCLPSPTSIFPATKGTSLEDGFCGEWAGRTETGEAKGYGFMANYLTSSQYDSSQSWYRLILSKDVGVMRVYLGRGTLLSVRCKKADITP